jgi:hypothetical protein
MRLLERIGCERYAVPCPQELVDLATGRRAIFSLLIVDLCFVPIAEKLLPSTRGGRSCHRSTSMTQRPLDCERCVELEFGRPTVKHARWTSLRLRVSVGLA